VLARLARVFLAVSLLAAWQSALQHTVEHVDELGGFVHLRGGHSEEGAELRCDVLAALTACAAQSAVALGPACSEHEAPAFPFSAPRLAQRPPFLSQGPPAPA
jgi:hypothetical protein